MVELPHTIVGAAIAAKIQNPYLALPLALFSHFVLDLLPHWNPHLNMEIKKFGRITKHTTIIITIDVVLSLVAGFVIASKFLPDVERFLIIIAACFLAVLPDVAEAPYFFFGRKDFLLARLIKFQSNLQFDVPIIPGIISQVIVVTAALWWIYN